MLSASHFGGGGVAGEKADLGTILSHDCGNKIQNKVWTLPVVFMWSKDFMPKHDHFLTLSKWGFKSTHRHSDRENVALL